MTEPSPWPIKLIRFIPELENLDPGEVTVWPEQEPKLDAEGRQVRTINYCYHPIIEQLLDAICEVAANDYDIDFCRHLIEDEAALANASLDDLHHVVTWMSRGERFSWGFFSGIVTGGTALRVLRRLEELA
jgi:hypothetical protein